MANSIVLGVRSPQWFVEELSRLGFKVYDYRGRGECDKADVVVVSPATPWTTVRELIECSGARFLAVLGSGVDNLDLDWLDSRGICVWNHPDYIADVVAEHAVGLALALLRNIVRGDRLVREGAWKGPAPRELLGTSLSGLRVGIVGLGRIGARLARLLLAFNVETPILYWSRRRKPEVERVLPLKFTGLEELFSSTNIVFITIALTSETRHLINWSLLSRLRGGFLINVSRGGVVDTNALVKALRDGVLAGAALDVFEEEPLPKDHPLTRMDNVVLTPHIGGYTRWSMEQTFKWILEEVVNVVRGGTPSYPLTSACRGLASP